MKKTATKLFSVLITAVLLMQCAVCVSAEGAVAEGRAGHNITWSLSASGELVLGGTGDMFDYSTYEDTPWRAYAMDIKSLKVGDGITSLGANALAMCPNLASVYLPEGLLKIGSGAFERCYSLKEMDIPHSVLEIGDRAFFECWRLKKFAIALYKSKLTSIGSDAFAMCSSLKNFNLPKTVVSIGDGAFRSCSTVTELILPDKLVSLGEAVFENCTSLTKINVPWQIEEIPDFSFFGCRSLETVSLGRYVSRIGREAFLWCESLTSLYIPDAITEIADNSVGFYYFSGEYIPYENVSVISSSSVVKSYARRTGIGFVLDDPTHLCDSPCIYCGRCTDAACGYYLCFDKCDGHTMPTVGQFTNGEETFAWMYDAEMTLAIVGKGDMGDFEYDSIPWEEFKSSIRKVIISEGITSIGAYAFEDCVSIETAELPETLASVGFKSFYSCTSLAEISLPSSVEEISRYAFAGCSSLQTVGFSQWLLAIGDYAFSGCGSLKSVELPEGILSLGACAFEGCREMEEAWLPSTVQSIGAFAFGYAYSSVRNFERIEGFSLCADLSQAAEDYGNKFDIPIVRTDIHICTSACPLCGRCLKNDCLDPCCASKCDGVCTAPFENVYNDVSETDWFFDGVKYTTQLGIMGGVGDGTFSPSGSFTRAQLVTVLWRMENEPTPKNEAPFADLEADWYRESVSWAYENGIVNGVSDESFAPSSPITREQMAAILMRYCTVIKGADTSARAELEGYPDSAEVSEYAREALSWAVSTGLITGSERDGELCLLPTGGATRAQAATVITRYIRMGL